MTSKKFVMSPRQAKIEELGSLDEEIKVLQERANKLKKQLGAKLGKFSGISFYVNAFERGNTKLDRAKVKRLLGPTKYKSCLVEGETQTVVTVGRL